MSGFDPVALLSAFAPVGHNGFIGLRYVAHGPDWIELAIDHDPRLVMDEASGILASGPIVAMMDMAAGVAIWIRQDRFVPNATLDLRVDYLRSARPGRTVYGRSECYRITRHVAFVRGQAHDGDPADPIAHVAGTFMFLGGRHAA